MRVTVTGATGGIGSRLVGALLERGDEVTVLSRNPEAATAKLGPVRALAWTPTDGPPPPEAIEHAGAVVNLAGESVAQRWTSDAKARILSSRVEGTKHLAQAIAAAPEDRRPGALVSGSAIGLYGDRHAPTDESAPAGTSGFLPKVAAAWEAEARRAEAAGVRVVLIRTGDVLAADDGVLPVLSKITKLGVMGPLGGGKQPFPWIHVADEVGLILHALGDARAVGPINAVAPGLVTQAEFAKQLGRKLRRPAFAPAPGFAVKLLRGEMAELILEGAAATPTAASELGYTFAFPELPGALDDLIR